MCVVRVADSSTKSIGCRLFLQRRILIAFHCLLVSQNEKFLKRETIHPQIIQNSIPIDKWSWFNRAKPVISIQMRLVDRRQTCIPSSYTPGVSGFQWSNNVLQNGYRATTLGSRWCCSSGDRVGFALLLFWGGVVTAKMRLDETKKKLPQTFELSTIDELKA